MEDTELRRLSALAEGYFADEDNQPYSMQEICALLGVCHDRLLDWERGRDAGPAALARSIRARVAAGWEKGRLPAGLATYLHRRYFGEEEPDGRLEVTVRVVGRDNP